MGIEIWYTDVFVNIFRYTLIVFLCKTEYAKAFQRVEASKDECILLSSQTHFSSIQWKKIRIRLYVAKFSHRQSDMYMVANVNILPYAILSGTKSELTFLAQLTSKFVQYFEYVYIIWKDFAVMSIQSKWKKNIS